MPRHEFHSIYTDSLLPACCVLIGMCMGSSTNHVVRFDGLALRLDGEGLCSYTLLTVGRGVSVGSEVKLHSGPCHDSANFNQICMKSMEVMHGSHKLLLKNDMTVKFLCVGYVALTVRMMIIFKMYLLIMCCFFE